MTQFASLSNSAIARMKGLIGFGAIATTLVLLGQPVQANDYERCTIDLAKKQLATEEVTSACARALMPREVGTCVNRISDRTGLSATETLNACRQVRRPLELADCTIEIRNRLGGDSMSQVLESCRRSLLPTRYADCVVGLAKSAKASTPQALDICIDAYYFPREVDPTFIPYPVTSVPTGAETPTLTPMPDLLAPAPKLQPAPTTPVPALW